MYTRTVIFCVLLFVVCDAFDEYRSCVKAIISKYFTNRSSNVTYLIYYNVSVGYSDKTPRQRCSTDPSRLWRVNEFTNRSLDDVEPSSVAYEANEFYGPYLARSFPVLTMSRSKVKTFNKLKNIIPSGYVMVVDDNLRHFQRWIGKINFTHQSWYPRSPFILCALTALNDRWAERSFMRQIAVTLGKFNVFNFVVLIPNDGRRFVLNVYGWFPFGRVNGCGRVNEVKLIDRWVDGRFVRDRNLFADKVPRRFPNCTMRITSFHWPPASLIDFDRGKVVNGYNFLAINMLAAYRNLTLEHVPSPTNTRWGVMFDNGTWNGMLGEVSKGNADVAFSGALQTLNRYMMHDMSTSFKSTYFKFYVPSPLKLPHWRNIVDIFSLRFWLFIAIVYALVCSVVCAFARAKFIRENHPFRSFVGCVFILWPGLVGTGSSLIPISTPVRIVFLMWLVYNLHLNLIYTSSLLGLLTRPNYEKPIDSIKRLVASDLKVHIIPQFQPISMLAADEDDDMRIIMRRLCNYTNYSDDIRTMLTARNISIFLPSDHFEYYSGRSRGVDIYAIPESVMRFNTAMYMKKGCVYFNAVSHMQRAVFENGLQSKCLRDLRSNELHTANRIRPSGCEHSMLPLTLHELQGSFYLLIFGLTSSALVFCIEVIVASSSSN